jgi:hypothetical protein
MSFICQYCNRGVTTKYNLTKHQKTQYCINAQNSMNIANKTKRDSNTISKSKRDLNSQILSNTMLKEIIKKHEATIKDLQDRIERLCSQAIEKPTTTNNTVKNKFNLVPFPSQREINSVIECKFTDKYMLDGITGVAQFVYDHIIKLDDGSVAYACFDRSRKLFKFKDSNGLEIRDPNASKLISMLKINLLKQNRRVLDFFNVEVDNMSYLRDRDGEIDEREFVNITGRRDKVCEVSSDIIFMDEKKSRFDSDLADLIC